MSVLHACCCRDLFPDDLCEMLSTLHDKAPVHSARHSRRSIQQAFGAPPEELFATFSDKPLASGSVAQVHVATLRAGSRGCGGSSGRRSSTDASAGLPVVVKVLHPGVAKRIAQDFRILGPIAEWAGRLKALKGLSLKESVSQFSATMTAQADLRVEAVHAQRFADNFEGAGPEGWVADRGEIRSFASLSTPFLYIRESLCYGLDCELIVLLVILCTTSGHCQSMK